MSEQHDNGSYADHYAGSAIRLTNRRTSATPQERSTRKRYAAQPEPSHRQSHSFGIHPADDNYSSDSFDVEGADYPDEPVRRRSSAVHYSTAPSRRETVHLQPKPTRVITRRRVDRATLVIWLCLALIVMVGGWWLLSAAANWWQGVQDNWTYGINPRTFQADQYVGLGDSPGHPDHFIALNLHGVIEVVQINPQDHTRDAVYVLTSVGNESVPASLSFRDVNGDGKIDIVVTIGDSTPYTIVMLNNGKSFQPTQAAH
jgi:hypothetical protein